MFSLQLQFLMYFINIYVCILCVKFFLVHFTDYFGGKFLTEPTYTFSLTQKNAIASLASISS